MSIDRLFGDAEDDPRWQWTELTAGAPPVPVKGYAVCSLTWLERVIPIVHTSTHLAVAVVLYSKCLRRRSQTITLTNQELKRLGISRYAKYRALSRLQEVGMLTIETRNGRSVKVTLHWFP
jgi:hypothetical protein